MQRVEFYRIYGRNSDSGGGSADLACALVVDREVL